MKRIIRPTPINEEIKLVPYKTIMSKTDPKGIIEYANDYFVEISEYKEWELMGQPHNVIRHPDMPKIVFKLLWDRLKAKQNIHAIVKNLSKSGRYYWVVTDFKWKEDEDGNVVAYYSRRKAIPEKVKLFMEEFYSRLRKIEEKGGMEASGAYLEGFFEDMGKTYDEFILDLFGLSEDELMKYLTAEISDEELMKGKGAGDSAEDAIKKTAKKGFFGKLFS
jgi:PAS domain S-box-containing protein